MLRVTYNNTSNASCYALADFLISNLPYSHYSYAEMLDFAEELIGGYEWNPGLYYIDLEAFKQCPFFHVNLTTKDLQNV